MEFLIECLLDLLLEGSIEISSNKKISKFVRYPLIFLIILFFGSVIFGLLFLGVVCCRKNFFGGLFIILVGFIMLVASIFEFRKRYLSRKD